VEKEEIYRWVLKLFSCFMFYRSGRVIFYGSRMRGGGADSYIGRYKIKGKAKPWQGIIPGL